MIEVYFKPATLSEISPCWICGYLLERWEQSHCPSCAKADEDADE